MKSQSIKKLYTLHSWVGVVSAILMFVICFTGAVAVFGQDELRNWANLDTRGDVSVAPEIVEKIVADAVTQIPEAYHNKLQINMPGRFYGDLVLVFEREIDTNDGHIHDGYMLRYDITSMLLTSKANGSVNDLYSESRVSNAADFIVRFHADLHLGTVGLILTGALGLVLMTSIVTGFIVHRKKLAQLFTFRPSKSFSLMLNDGHKQLGVWGLLFHGVIGFTGAFLGLATVILIPAAAYVSFGGDQEKLVETFLVMKEPELSQEYQPTPLAQILTESTLDGEQTITFVNVLGLNDANAMTYVTVTGTQAMARNQLRFYDKNQFVEQTGNFSRLEGVSGGVLELMFPLHFGNFGGILIKILWTILGLTTALLPLSGLMLWVERGVTSPVPRFRPQTYDRLNRVLLGSCGGVVLACVTVFHAQLIIFATKYTGDISTIMLAVFFTTWLLGIGWALLYPRLRKAVQYMLRLTSILLVMVMPLNAIITNSHIFNVLETGHTTTLIIDVVFLVLGILLWRSIDKVKVTELSSTDREAKLSTGAEREA